MSTVVVRDSVARLLLRIVDVLNKRAALQFETAGPTSRLESRREHPVR